LSKVVVFTLGFDTTAITTKLVETTLEPRDAIVLIVPNTESERATAAIKSIEGLLEILRSRGLNLRLYVITVNELSFVESVATIYKTIASLNAVHVEIDVSGGMRVLGLATYTAATLLASTHPALRPNMRLTLRLESNGAETHAVLPLLEIPNNLDLLKTIQEEPDHRLSVLSAKLRRDISTLSRQIRVLREKGLIVEGEPRYEISELGRLFLMCIEVKE